MKIKLIESWGASHQRTEKQARNILFQFLKVRKNKYKSTNDYSFLRLSEPIRNKGDKKNPDWGFGIDVVVHKNLVDYLLEDSILRIPIWFMIIPPFLVYSYFWLMFKVKI